MIPGTSRSGATSIGAMVDWSARGVVVPPQAGRENSIDG
jgi:hypothetical protein